MIFDRDSYERVNKLKRPTSADSFLFCSVRNIYSYNKLYELWNDV